MPQSTKTTDTAGVLVFDAKNPGSGDPVYRQTYPSWGTFMNNNAVWESNINATQFNRTYSFSVPSTSVGTASALVAVDDDVQVSIDGAQVFTDAQTFTTVRTVPINLSAGNHTISWTAQNRVGPSGGSGPGGLSLLIYANTLGVPSGIDYSLAEVNQVLGYFTPGNRVRANHVNELLDLYARFQGHKHGLTDIVRLKTFGNTGSSLSVSGETNTVSGTNPKPSNVAAGTQITAAQHALVREALNSLRTHFHSWSDN